MVGSSSLQTCPKALIATGSRYTAAVVVDLFWKPYDARFRDLLDELKFHRQVLRDYLDLAQYQEDVRHQKTVSEALKEAAEERLRAAESRFAVKQVQSVSEEMKEHLELKSRGTL